jgi:microcystin-dependent protein
MSSTNGNLFIGDEAGNLGAIGFSNTAIGVQSGSSLTTADASTFLGFQSGNNVTTGSDNTFLGAEAGKETTTGSNNTFTGFESGINNLTGTNNAAYGSASMHEGTSSNNNVAIGTQAGYNINNDDNTFVGHQSGYSSTIAIENTFLGGLSGYNNLDGSSNVLLGYNAGLLGVSADSVVAVGHSSGNSNTVSNNTFLGTQTGYENTTGRGQTMVGYQSGYNNTTGENNTLFGTETGYSLQTGNANLIAGARAGYSLTTGSRNIIMGSASTYGGLDAAGYSLNTGNDDVIIGSKAGKSLTNGSRNIIMGSEAGNTLLTGAENVLIGHLSGQSLVAQSGNVMIGNRAGQLNTNATGNNIMIGDKSGSNSSTSTSIFMGADAGLNSTGTYNIGIGYESLKNVSPAFGNTSTGNVFIGHHSGRNVRSGSRSVAIGGGLSTGSAGVLSSITDQSDNTAIGYLAGRIATSDGNTLIGSKTGYSLISGGLNSMLGYQAGYSTTSGQKNVFFGNDSGYNASTSSENTFIGYQSGYSTNTQSKSVAIGTQAGYNNTSTGVVSIGYRAGYANQLASYNLFIGYEAAGKEGNLLNASAVSNVFIGYHAGYNATGGASKNILIGSLSGAGLTEGQSNIMIGDQSGNAIGTGSKNIFIGPNSIGLKSENVDNNVFIGSGSGQENVSGNDNLFIGTDAGKNSTDSFNICFGTSSGKNMLSGENNIYIGNSAAENNNTGSNNIVFGSFTGQGTGSSYSDSILIGNQAGRNNESDNFLSIGTEAGKSNTSGEGNINIGYQSGFSNSIGNNNINIGSQAGFYTISSDNIFIGAEAGKNNTIGTNNILLGGSAGQSNAVGINNIFMGTEAGKFTTTSNNIAIGTQAGVNNISGTRNIYVGFRSGYNSINSNNIFLGNESGFNVTTGEGNLFMGSQSGYNTTIGGGNVFMGYQSGFNNTTGKNSMFIGFEAGYNNETGSDSLYLGYQSGYNNVSGSNNLAIGYRSQKLNTVGNQNIAIGNYSLFGNQFGDNNMVMGTNAASTGDIGDNNTIIGINSSRNIKNPGYQNNIIMGFNSNFQGFASTGSIVMGTNAVGEGIGGQNNIIMGVNAGQNLGGSIPTITFAGGPYSSPNVNKQGFNVISVGSASVKKGQYLVIIYNNNSVYEPQVIYITQSGLTESTISSNLNADINLTTDTVHLLYGFNSSVVDSSLAGNSYFIVKTPKSAFDTLFNINDNITIQSLSSTNSQIFNIVSTVVESSLSGTTRINIDTTLTNTYAEGDFIYLTRNKVNVIGTSDTSKASTNILIGNNTGNLMTYGAKNIAIGDDALVNITTEKYNTAIGTDTGYHVKSESNFLLGTKSGYYIDYANQGEGENTMIGFATGQYAGITATVSNNVYIGNRVGQVNQGSNNIFIGNERETATSWDVDSATQLSNKIVIYKSDVGIPTNPLIGGDIEGDKLGILTMDPNSTLDVKGSFAKAIDTVTQFSTVLEYEKLVTITADIFKWIHSNINQCNINKSALDSDGNLYLIGYSYGTSVIIGTQTFTPIDPPEYIGFMCKINKTTNLVEWFKWIKGPNSAYGIDIVIKNNIIYATAFIIDSQTFKIDEVQYSPGYYIYSIVLICGVDGTIIDVKYIAYANNTNNSLIAVDNNNNFYVCIHVDLNETDLIRINGIEFLCPANILSTYLTAKIIIKFDSNRNYENIKWIGWDVAANTILTHGINVDNSGNLYILGYPGNQITIDTETYTFSPFFGTSIIIKFNNLNFNWLKWLDSSFDYLLNHSMVVDSNSDLYLAINLVASLQITLTTVNSLSTPVPNVIFYNPIPINTNATIILKFNSEGQIKYNKWINQAGFNNGSINNINVDNLNNLYLIGPSTDGIIIDSITYPKTDPNYPTGTDIVFLKLTYEGEVLNCKYITGYQFSSAEQFIYNILVNPEYNIYIIANNRDSVTLNVDGTSYSNSGFYSGQNHGFYVKYDQSDFTTYHYPKYLDKTDTEIKLKNNYNTAVNLSNFNNTQISLIDSEFIIYNEKDITALSFNNVNRNVYNTNLEHHIDNSKLFNVGSINNVLNLSINIPDSGIISVVSTNDIVDGVTGLLVIGSELIQFNGKNNGLGQATRGYQSTIPTTHTAGSTVYNIATSVTTLLNTSLTNNMTDITTNVSMNPSGFPASGNLIIDSEIIYYPDNTPYLFDVVRGSNSTTASSHTALDSVFLVKDSITALAFSNLEDGITASTTQIQVVDMSQFTSNGFIIVEDEIIEYDNVALIGLERGTNGTTPVLHGVDSVVRLISTSTSDLIYNFLDQAIDTIGIIGVTAMPPDTIILNNASTFPSNGTILIEAEIITYNGKTANYLENVVRGINGTIAVPHLYGSSVYIINNGLTTQGTINLLSDSSDILEFLTGHHDFPKEGTIQIDSEVIKYYDIVLYNISRTYGNIHDHASGITCYNFSNLIDSTTLAYTINSVALNISITNYGNFTANGTILIGEELITYSNGIGIVNVVRGIAGTTPVSHNLNTKIYSIPLLAPSHSTLSHNIENDESGLPVVDNTLYNTQGMLLIDSEIIAYYNKKTLDNVTRGYSGSTAASHLNGVDVYLMTHINAISQLSHDMPANAISLQPREDSIPVSSISEFSSSGKVQIQTLVNGQIQKEIINYTNKGKSLVCSERGAYESTIKQHYVINRSTNAGVIFRLTDLISVPLKNIIESTDNTIAANGSITGFTIFDTIRIGYELFKYSYKNYGLGIAERGYRGSTIATHSVDNDVYDLQVITSFPLNSNLVGDNKINSTDLSIPVQTSLDAYPSSGYIVLGTEIINYTSKNQSLVINSASNRGLYGSPINFFSSGTSVSLVTISETNAIINSEIQLDAISLTTSNTFSSSGYVKVDREVIEYTTKDKTIYASFRGAFAKTAVSHSSGAAVRIISIASSTYATLNILAGATIILLNNTTTFPSSGFALIYAADQNKSEIVQYSSKTLTSINGVTRNIFSTGSNSYTNTGNNIIVYSLVSITSPSTLESSINESDTYITLVDGSSYPSLFNDANYVLIDQEFIPITSRYSLNGLTRYINTFSARPEYCSLAESITINAYSTIRYTSFGQSLCIGLVNANSYPSSGLVLINFEWIQYDSKNSFEILIGGRAQFSTAAQNYSATSSTPLLLINTPTAYRKLLNNMTTTTKVVSLNDTNTSYTNNGIILIYREMMSVNSKETFDQITRNIYLTQTLSITDTNYDIIKTTINNTSNNPSLSAIIRNNAIGITTNCIPFEIADDPVYGVTGVGLLDGEFFIWESKNSLDVLTRGADGTINSLHEIDTGVNIVAEIDSFTLDGDGNIIIYDLDIKGDKYLLSDEISGIRLTDSLDITTFPSSGVVLIDNEQILYQSNNAIADITRGTNSTVATTHTEDDYIYLIDTTANASLTNTTLSASIVASSTQITLVSVSGFASSGNIIIGSEIINYTSILGTILTGCTRGRYLTPSASHQLGDIVYKIESDIIRTSIVQNVDVDDYIIGLASNASYPSSGTVLIGSEIMTYEYRNALAKLVHGYDSTQANGHINQIPIIFTDIILTDKESTILVDTTSGNVTVNLPSAIGIEGRIYTIKKISSVNSVIVEPYGSELIDNSSNLTITSIQDYIGIQSNGMNWKLILSSLYEPVGSVEAAIEAVVDGAPENLNTLSKIANAINNDPAFSAAIASTYLSIINAALTYAPITPVGTIVSFAGLTAPSKWLLCAGQSLATATYPALYDAIGYTYGGSGPNFNLPDCRGRTLVAPDAMGGTSANRVVTNNLLGNSAGAETIALAEANIPSHHHKLFSNTVAEFAGDLGSDTFVHKQYIQDLNSINYYMSSVQPPNTGSATVGKSSNVGSGTAFNKMSPYIVVNYIIYTNV